ncbi:hypothetical protein TCE0_041f14080 [Talaromyces pinophilus]|uniref:Trichothecene 3-O-acetyltransferase-like N-terminal domain-containing protein n=1 Tax=Talaromyces pinophilus TaxID=128442 RepID=A0A6V8HK20_TALPI|nr:hypothetical protein TCE0_041f14080 [Talaromyces pinophilus]
MEGPVRYELSDVDRQAPDAIVKCFTFCKPQENLNMDKLIETLQQGLDNAIEQLPIMSGNIVVDQSGKPYIEVVPGTRVKLAVKHYSSNEHKYFADLAQNSFHPEDLDLATLLPELLPADHQPACWLQLNVIEGGLILAFAAHHFAVDFKSIHIFLGAIRQGSKAYYHGDPLPKLAVSLDRKPFNGHPIPEGVSKQDLLEKCPEYQVIDLKEAFSCRSNAVDMADYQAKLYKISDAETAELKEQCNLSEDVKYVSAFDCILAALWKSITRARVSITPEKQSAQSFLYFGNAVILTQTGPLDTQTLLEDETISIAASSIRQSINAPDEKLKLHVNYEDMDFLVNSWFLGKPEDYDFGAGVPEAFRPKPNPLKAASCNFLPTFRDASKGTRELLIQLRAKEHEMLMEDDFFIKYFQPVSYPACDSKPLGACECI